jgi:outer membrane protein assembly factor BamB
MCSGRTRRPPAPVAVCGLAAVLAAASAPLPLERATFGVTPAATRSSPAVNLPAVWDPGTGLNVRWIAALGTETYGGPVAAGGKVFVGTNNARPRDPSRAGDRGVLMAFDAVDGELLWQATHPKLATGSANDWPQQGVCSTPAVEGDRLFYVSNRGELVAADTEGFRDGENDGPWTAEERAGPLDADLVWRLDMPTQLGVYPRFMSASSPLVVGDLVYVVTGNGVDGTGRPPAAAAPSFLAVDKRSGQVVWQQSYPGTGLVDGQWASPSWSIADGRPQVVFPAGDGWLYALEPATGKLLWKFDAGASRTRGASGADTARRKPLVASAALDGRRAFFGVGHDPQLGPEKGWLWAVDAPAAVGGAPVPAWRFDAGGFSTTLSTAAVHDGLVYAADLRGVLHCLDATNGVLLWSYDALAEVWGSPLVADGKVFLADTDGDVAVLAAGRTRRLLAEVNMGQAIHTSPAAEDGGLFVASRTHLYLIAAQAPSQGGRETGRP